MSKTRYLIALGGNTRHVRFGSPRAVLKAALHALDHGRIDVEACSPIIETAPLGPSRRRYANAVAIVHTKCDPDELLHTLHKIEHKFGRKRYGAQWRARVLDLDIVLWSEGAFTSDDLVIPHPFFRKRGFVLKPASQIAGSWRDPLSGLTIRQLFARATKFSNLT